MTVEKAVIDFDGDLSDEEAAEAERMGVHVVRVRSDASTVDEVRRIVADYMTGHGDEPALADAHDFLMAIERAVR